MNLLKIRLIDFKGIRNMEFNFWKRTLVAGENGAGKTTLFDAHLWLFSDKNSSLQSNPDIRPDDGRECIPTVEEEWDIDGAIVSISKMQKKSVGKPNEKGISKVTLSNTYAINSVPKTERDFKRDLTEKGFDFDNFLPLSHIEVFTGNKSSDMRKVLFKMATSKTDQEIASTTEGCSEVAALLQTYKAEEIEAMNKASKKKADEQLAAIPNQIIGMEKSKTDIDVAELELLKNSLNEQIDHNREKQEDISKELEEQQKLSDNILELKFELNDLQRKSNESLDNKRREIRRELDDLDWKIKEVKHQIRLNKQDIQSAEDSIEKFRKRIEAYRNDWSALNEKIEKEKELVFDDSSLACPYCGQEYRDKRKEQLRTDFESHKREEIKRLEGERDAVVTRGNCLKKAIEKDKTEIEQLKSTLKENEDEEINLAESIKGLEKSLEEVPKSIDISDRSEVQEIQRKIAEKEAAMNKHNRVEEIRQHLRDELADLQSQLTEVEKQLALAQKNMEIDDQIACLRKKQSEYEQQSADAKNILDQLSLISRAKNTLLEKEINDHFIGVRFRLFDYQKNGEYKETCIPEILNEKGEWKSIGSTANTALEMKGKLGIISGLQKFYGVQYPVFVDYAAELDNMTMKQIHMDFQIIFLKVNNEGLKVEEMA